MSADPKAVFLSYAREDLAAARRIAEALRAAGVEVWFDEDELRGGDAWDAKIRQQIRECALFLPIISERTQARAEGYFRLEWKLADRRTDLIGKSKPFLLPVCIDQTAEKTADVPDSFLTVQWTRLPGGETPPAFVQRVASLLGGLTPEANPSGPAKNHATVAAPAPTGRAVLQRRNRLAVPLIAAALVGLALVLWRPWSRRDAHAIERPAAARSSPVADEVARLRARLIPHAWKKEDFEPFSAALDRILSVDEQNADAWALRSIINSLQVIRNYEAGTKPLETGRVAAYRALHIAPTSALAELALGMHLTAMNSRGADARAARPHLRKALAVLPADALTRFADVSWAINSFDFEALKQSTDDWLRADATANHAAFLRGMMHLALREPAAALQWAERGAGDANISGARSFVTAFDVHYYLRGDLKAARGVLDRVPASAPAVHRGLFARWLLAMAEQRYELALQELARTPETTLFDRPYRGPKAVLAGMAYQALGNSEAAHAQFNEAQRMLQEQLAQDRQDEDLHAVLALVYAYLGKRAEAQRELSLVEPLVRGRERNIRSGLLMMVLAQTHAALGQTEPLTNWLREMLSGPLIPPFTPASLRLDPRFKAVVAQPEVQAVLADFAHVDANAGAAKPVEKSIAVLAFANRSDDRATEYFSDGISEELLNVLGKVPGLQVAGWTSALAFKGRDANADEIGQKLRVAHFVDGSVRKSGSRVQIRARLTRTDNGTQIWSDTYDEELKDIFALQDKIARDIAEKLQLRLGGAPRTKTINPEAHRLVLEGRHFWNQRSREGFDRAEALYKQAILLEPRFAAAQAGLALVYIVRANYRNWDGHLDNQSDIALGRDYAQRAIDLDPSSADAYASLGYALMMEGRLAEAEAPFRTALQRNLNSAAIRSWNGILHSMRGDVHAAVAECAKALESDPLWMANLSIYGGELVRARKFADAVVLGERGVGFNPEFIPNRAVLANAYFGIGDRTKAVAEARYILSHPTIQPRWRGDMVAVWVLAQTGHHDEALASARRCLEVFPPDSFMRGFIHAGLGRFEDALPFLARVPIMQGRSLFYDEAWDPWRKDPRFVALIENLGWTEHYRRARAALGEPQAGTATKK